jgi:hypothetical protein
MLTAAAVCPHPPALVPEMTGSAWRDGVPGLDGSAPAAQELGRLRTACDTATTWLLAQRPDLLVIVGGAGRSAEYPAAAPGSLAPFGLPGKAGDDAPALPLSLTIGRWLLGRAMSRDEERGASPMLSLVSVAWSAPRAACLGLGAELASRAPRVALLVMGDGTARRARGVPGAADPEAERYDAGVAAALAGADAAKLAGLDPGLSAELFAAGRAAWQVLAGAVDAGGPAGVRGDLRYAATPFEVTYFVATWHRVVPHGAASQDAVAG